VADGAEVGRGDLSAVLVETALVHPELEEVDLTVARATSKILTIRLEERK